MSSAEEKIYLKKAVVGDRAALDYLVLRYKDMAFTVAMKIVSSREDAEEVVQDSFVKAFSSLGSFKEMSKFSTWLYRIVYNTAITKAHHEKSQRIADKHIESVEALPTGNIGWNTLISAEHKKYLDLALQDLSLEDRTIIVLYYIAEKNISEICEIVGLKKSAVKMRLLRARKQLAEVLETILHDEINDFL